MISVEKGRLPFKSDIKVCKVKRDFPNAKNYADLNAACYSWIQRVIASSKAKSIVIDDSQYLLVNELFDRAKEKSYDKFTDMAVNFRNLIHFINDLPEEDKIVYFLHHSEAAGDGREKAKTIGRMLDEKLTLEGALTLSFTAPTTNSTLRRTIRARQRRRKGSLNRWRSRTTLRRLMMQSANITG